MHAPSLHALYAHTQRVHRCAALDVDAVSNAGNLTPLSAPFPVFDFDFYHVPSDDRSVQLQVPARADGVAHGVVLWWTTELDANGHIALTTAPAWVGQGAQSKSRLPKDDRGKTLPPPLPQQWREHWQPCFVANAAAKPVTAGG